MVFGLHFFGHSKNTVGAESLSGGPPAPVARNGVSNHEQFRVAATAQPAQHGLGTVDYSEPKQGMQTVSGAAMDMLATSGMQYGQPNPWQYGDRYELDAIREAGIQSQCTYPMGMQIGSTQYGDGNGLQSDNVTSCLWQCGIYPNRIPIDWTVPLQPGNGIGGCCIPPGSSIPSNGLPLDTGIVGVDGAYHGTLGTVPVMPHMMRASAGVIPTTTHIAPASTFTSICRGTSPVTHQSRAYAHIHADELNTASIIKAVIADKPPQFVANTVHTSDPLTCTAATHRQRLIPIPDPVDLNAPVRGIPLEHAQYNTTWTA